MVQGLTVKEMSELRDDIKMHLDLDRATPTHVEYWEVSPCFHCLISALSPAQLCNYVLPYLTQNVQDNFNINI
jgi:hypothetical protein